MGSDIGNQSRIGCQSLSETSLATARRASMEGKLLVFAGAGISMLPPSCLPDWKGFNRSLLEEIKASALSLPNLIDEAAAVIRRLDIDSLGVEAFSDIIVESLARDDYFPLLKILDSDRPNAYHLAMAKLGQSGACPAIVTTNFDRLLERAFAPDLLEVFATPEDFRRNPQKPCALYKVHGSVDDASTLRDTVSQKLRGLPLPVRARLVELFREHHVMVVGFSGADLDFGSDYLALSSLRTGGHGVTWIVQPGRSLGRGAEEVVRAAGGTCVEGDLSEVFTSLGVTIQTPTEAGDKIDGGQSEVDRRTRAYVGDWLKSLALGSFSSLIFCAAMTRYVGEATDVRTLRRAVIHELDSSGDVPPGIALYAFDALSALADKEGDFEASGHWANGTLRVLSFLDELRRTGSDPARPADLHMTSRRSSAWLQLGRSRYRLGDLQGAREAFDCARRAAMQAGDGHLLSLAIGNEGMLLDGEDASAERQLLLFRRAWSIAARNGSARAMTAMAGSEAATLLKIGEYDAALAAIGRTETVTRWSRSLEGRLSPDLTRAEIALRRGHIEEAFRAYDAKIAESAADPIAQAKLREIVAASIVYVPGGRDRSIRYLSQILEAMADGAIPRDGMRAGVKSEAEIREFREWVSTIELSQAPGLHQFVAAEPEEWELRAALIRAEYERDSMGAAVALFRLAKGRFSVTRPRRQLDLAEAAMTAAERAGDRDLKVRSLLLLISARDHSGNFQGAIDAARQVLEAEPPVDEELRVCATLSLGTVLTRAGRSGEGLPLLRSAQQTFRRAGPRESYVGSTLTLARALAGDGDRAGALDVLGKAKDAIDSTADRLAIATRDAMVATLTAADDRSGPPPFFSDKLSNHRAAGLDRAPVEVIESLRRATELAAEKCELAALAIRSGETRAAVEMLLEAQAGLHGNNDEEGVARSFHLLADAAHVDGRWDEALDLTRYALEVEEALKDVPGVIASYAALAVELLQVGELDAAKEAAGESLVRAAGGPVSRFTAIAKYAAAEARRRAGDGSDPEADDRLYADINTAADLPAGSPLRLWLEDRAGRWDTRRRKSLVASLWAKVFGGGRKRKSCGLV
jgi:tetratricopeptide (TPR) repeat protein